MATKRRIFEFDDFRVDSGQFLVTKNGNVEPISPTVFKILLLLLERAGEVVTKEELMTHVWPDTIVEEGNLNRNVSTLRKALHETPRDHRYIETIPKTGYRFVASIRTLDYQPPAGIAQKPVRQPESVIGRELERDTLSRAFDRAQQGQGGLVCISGDAGIGKTTLIDTFVTDLLKDKQTFHLVRARCSESLTESEPLIPWIEGVSTLSAQPAMSDALLTTAPAWHAAITHTGPAVHSSMKRELLDFFKHITPVHPLVVVIDDFHWADVASVDLLSFLAKRVENTRTLIVVCYQLTEMKIKNHAFLRLRSELLSREACIELRLGPLNRKQVEQYLALEHLTRKLPSEFADQLYAKSEGNPLFMRELIKEHNCTTDSMRHIVQGKLDRLDDTHRQLLVTASVHGREFDSAILANTLEVDSQDVEETLQELDEVYGMIQRIREEEIRDGKVTVRYRFAHGLYQEACYASLAPTRKASVSASLADALLTYYGN